MIRIGLVGLGKTGRIVAQSLNDDDRFDFVYAVKKKLPKLKDYAYSVETKEMVPQLIKMYKPQAIIDFSSPCGTLCNSQHLKQRTALVIGTTGFDKQEVEKLKALQKRSQLKVLFAPNISSGINILIKSAKEIAKLWPKADIEIIEQHFKTKRDAPSGTAKKIANIFAKKVPIHAVRAGGIVGIHEVIFAGSNQKITIKHESFSREVFAQSAKEAVIWLLKQKPGFYEMSDMYGY